MLSSEENSGVESCGVKSSFAVLLYAVGGILSLKQNEEDVQ